MKAKDLFIYFIIFIISHIVTYFFAGIISNALGVFDFYPPSPAAISYLRNPHDPLVWKLMFPAQILRGALYALAFLPIIGWIKKQHQFKGGLIIGSIIFLVGYVAASGGLIEHTVFFTEYPLRFALISLVEIATYSFLFGQAVMLLSRKFLHSSK
ncbi:MAG: hypothetical protein M1142_03445 [Patescibacteria group bacterium]|nr:hypothetical protein [Patescibacteria group bacterium]